MSDFVVDANVGVKWVVPEELSDQASSLMGENLVAPSLWLSECANVLWVKARKEELSSVEAMECFDLIRHSPVRLIPVEDLFPLAMTLALRVDHPVYDLLYLAAALERDMPLVTADGLFVKALEPHPELRSMVIALKEL